MERDEFNNHKTRAGKTSRATSMSEPDSPTRMTNREVRDPARTPVRILCVEDNECDFLLIRRHLRDAGFSAPIDIQRARTMGEAVGILGRDVYGERCDMVLLDLSLPDSRGAETYHRLREAAPRVAVAILSGNNDESLALDLVQHGAQDYLPKDALTPDLLMRCIIYAMKRQHHRVEMEALTRRLRATTEELKTLQMQLIQAEKLESLGRLASSVAHEVKNPLGVIQMGIDYLTGHVSCAAPDVKRTLGLMQEAVGRADAIIHDMLDFSRTNLRRVETCNLNSVVHCAIRMLQHEIDRRNLSLRLELMPSLPRTLCNATEMQQVLINIMMNSIHAMERHGVLTVRTRSGVAGAIRRDQGLREMNLMREGDEVVIIEVRDEGPGIPDEIMGRICETFFTTKPTGEGTGLGLSVCKRIIENHRGQLSFANVGEPRGLLVSIVLKAESISDTQTKTSEAPSAEPDVSHTETASHETETHPRR